MNLYDARLLHLDSLIQKLTGRINYLSGKSNKFSFYRLLIFISGIALTVAGFMINSFSGWTFFAVSLIIFGITVHFHNRLIHGIRRLSVFLNIKKQHRARTELDWKNIPHNEISDSNDEISLSKDLDLTGYRSLHHLTDISVSNEGSMLLSGMLQNLSPDAADIQFKQKIIKELTGETIFRDKFLLKAELISKKKIDCGKIEEWVKSVSETELPVRIMTVSFLLIVSYIILLILNLAEVISALWIPVFLVYFILYSKQQKKIKESFDDISEIDKHLKKITALISLTRKINSGKNETLKEFLRLFISEDKGAVVQLERIQKINTLILWRENPVIRILVNFLFPFDFYLSRKLNGLKNEIKNNISAWLKKMNELECYISLSNFAYLNSDYSFPEFAFEEINVFESVSIGHPLIKRNVKVCNDFRFTEKNEIFIITGSNMSGKSTFLKTIGINLCLAYAGAPVNAELLRISPYKLFTCIKVSDSVADGISYFYAEVKRLKFLLDEFKTENRLKIFFLIDEIFKGTNNRERLTGSYAYIKHLSGLNCTGAVSTHDLELARIADEIQTIKNYHFREEIKNSQMIFDYKIHPGACPTTNALRIMEISGLPVK